MKAEPWDRLPDEGDKPFRYFREFLHTGPRSLTELAKRLSLSVETMNRYSSRYSWYARAAAWVVSPISVGMAIAG